MLTCNQIHPAGSWPLAEAVDTVQLDFDGRHRRRHMMHGVSGLSFLLDLPRAALLRSGDGLVLDDGRIVAVEATPERLIEITAPDMGTLIRITWHLGNRHLPTQLLNDRLLIRFDHVIRDMVQKLGGTTQEIDAPFDPEGGAFADGHGHGHAHGHDHTHDNHEHGDGHGQHQHDAHSHPHP